ncbi:isoleucine--tRNA ligase [Dellaglioa algida]|uniref:Isoleucine--tRNA ligase n=1 Tax=Dellaglioa algida TaxID=105612 RepID=A0A5C6M999_9LACO|nr:isoleucine--tRNA ligase [Dellaglioa algida]MDK1717391.1 isoleucine--tRNA ligase [Dellaglioa algida]MDK1720734.1 isoleucine--tRNA ligase [Dellaglioa algida]MDK1722333.1 isoleucine--tRNA ligase [Dellaglioa algida]MDK1723957.1 isoleucine--tRNA ligase [Dellaglioa algida]MDK1725608.1 isoleucine--tRNA ligase [Dellaglioa algida]
MKMKETLNLGKTEFPMRGNLPVKEAERQDGWNQDSVYELRQKLNENKPSFILHDGPPYANGNIHMGHALNKITKDIIVRSKSMMGFRAPYVPGWDTHGLPIEQQLVKQGVDRKKMSKAAFRELCEKYALEQVNLQREDFKRLGVAAEWDNPYMTLQPEFEAEEVRMFGEMAEKGYIYKGKKPIYWSPSSESALAEAEIEYQDIKSPSMYITFDVVDGKDILDTDTKMIIWTTTPWTIPANYGVAVHPDYKYIQIDADGTKYVVAEERLSVLKEEFDWENVEVLKEFSGRDMEYMTVQHPLYDRTSLVILGYHVTLDSGTGLVHTAPGHGEDDFIAGQKYKLPVVSVLDEKGIMNEDAPGFEGIFYDKANPLVTDQLKENGHLLKLSFFTHSYPHDWRTKKPVVFRATAQWFASVEMFRDDILKEIDKVDFKNEWGKVRLYNMIKDRGDWVISRQRAWGVPLPIFYAEDGTPIITPETIEHVAQLFEEHGSNIWFKHDAKALLPEGFTSEHSPNGGFTKEEDIMDVWFDSGSSHRGVLGKRDNLTYPADLYMEGSDQYRGWFNSSIITSVATNGIAPYKQLMSQGFVLDDKGHKMSKSLGNIILPSKVIKQSGAEIIRLWTASADTSSDVAVSMDILKQVSETYRKIRNTFKFILANTTDFEPSKNAVAFDDLASADKYMLIKLNAFSKEVLDNYAEYDFLAIYKKVITFISNDLSAFYLDIAKDIVYIEAEDSFERRSMQTVLYQIVTTMAKLLTPILPHTTEEVWDYLKEPEEYIQLSEMPEVAHFDGEIKIVENWQAFMKMRSHVLKVLEDARDAKLIGKSFEAKVSLYVNDSDKALLDALNTDVRQQLIVSDLEILSVENAPEDATKFDNLAVKVEVANGEVCQRCRMIKTDVGENPELPTLCHRCATIVERNYPKAVTEGFEN